MSALEGRIVLVTGAARGVGKALAQACRQAGARDLHRLRREVDAHA